MRTRTRTEASVAFQVRLRRPWNQWRLDVASWVLGRAMWHDVRDMLIGEGAERLKPVSIPVRRTVDGGEAVLLVDEVGKSPEAQQPMWGVWGEVVAQCDCGWARRCEAGEAWDELIKHTESRHPESAAG